jgi:hypothetical protein
MYLSVVRSLRERVAAKRRRFWTHAARRHMRLFLLLADARNPLPVGLPTCRQADRPAA